MGDMSVAAFAERMERHKKRGDDEKKLLKKVHSYYGNQKKILESRAYNFAGEQTKKEMRAVAMSHRLTRFGARVLLRCRECGTTAREDAARCKFCRRKLKR